MADKTQKAKSLPLAAVIHIGGNAAKLKISQAQKGKIVDLERLTYPLSVGHDVFSDGHIGFNSIKEINKALTGFLQVIREYDVKQIRTVTASALRDALNRAAVIDRLKIACEIDIDVLENSVEKPLIYHSCISAMNKEKISLANGNNLFAFIGSGTIGLAFAEGQRMVWSQNLPFGALKISDTIEEMRGYTENFVGCAEELLRTLFNRYTDLPLAKSKDKLRLILAGSNTATIAKLIDAANDNDNVCRLSAKSVADLRRKMLQDSFSLVTVGKFSSQMMGISEETMGTIGSLDFDLLFTVLTIYLELITRTRADEIFMPKTALVDSVMEQMLVPGAKTSYRKTLRENSLSCAERMAVNFGCDKKHNDFVGKVALKFFDKLKDLHSLGEKDRLVLAVAAILDGCGKVVSARGLSEASYDIIRRSEIYGMTFRQRLYIANILLADEFSEPNFAAWQELTNKEQTVIAKLAAIFRLAKALDISGKQKISSVNAKINEDFVDVTVKTAGDIFLEQRAFKKCATFFRLVYGFEPALHVNNQKFFL